MKLLMVQKSGLHQFRLVVYPMIYDGFVSSQMDSRISEPSTEEVNHKSKLFEMDLDDSSCIHCKGMADRTYFATAVDL